MIFYQQNIFEFAANLLEYIAGPSAVALLTYTLASTLLFLFVYSMFLVYESMLTKALVLNVPQFAGMLTLCLIRFHLIIYVVAQFYLWFNKQRKIKIEPGINLSHNVCQYKF